MLPLSQSVYLHCFTSFPAVASLLVVAVLIWPSSASEQRPDQAKNFSLRNKVLLFQTHPTHQYSSIISRHKYGLSQICRIFVLREKQPAQRPSAPQQNYRGRQTGRGPSKQHIARCEANVHLRQDWDHGKGAILKERDPLEVAGPEKQHNSIS